MQKSKDWNQEKFKVGDKVKYARYYFALTDENKDVIHTILTVQKVDIFGTTGQWVTTDKSPSQSGDNNIDAYWFEHVSLFKRFRAWLNKQS